MMRAVALITMLAAACGSSQPAPAPEAKPAPAPVSAPAPKPAPAPAFTPTAFAVHVTGSGRPMILIPGLGCPASVWDETVAHLHGQAHVIEIAGFAGQHALPAGTPLAATVRGELATYIRDRHLDHPIVIGHSMGGFIALWLAASEPELVGPTVVVDAGALIGDGSEDSARKMRDLWATTTDAEMRDELRQMFALMSNNTRRIEPVIQAVQRSDRHAIADSMYELFKTDLRAKMANITAPVRLILADGPFQKDLAASVDAIPTHDVRVIPSTRHFVMFDDPPRFFAAVDDFLRAHP